MREDEGRWSAICSNSATKKKMPYGMLEFAVKDPNGDLLSFGQRIA
jgi:hypothetical protein